MQNRNLSVDMIANRNLDGAFRRDGGSSSLPSRYDLTNHKTVAIVPQQITPKSIVRDINEHDSGLNYYNAAYNLPSIHQKNSAEPRERLQVSDLH